MYIYSYDLNKILLSSRILVIFLVLRRDTCRQIHVKTLLYTKSNRLADAAFACRLPRLFADDGCGGLLVVKKKGNPFSSGDCLFFDLIDQKLDK